MLTVPTQTAVLGLAVCLGAAAPALAQRPRLSPEERVQAILAEWKDKLALTDEQARNVEPILTEREKQAQVDRESAAGDREAAMKLARERNQKYEAQVEAVLTPEQRKKLGELREERRKRMRERFGDGPPGRP